MSVTTIKAQSWEHFMDIVRADQAGRLAGGRIYRGQSDADWPLSSSFERWLSRYRHEGSNRPVSEFVRGVPIAERGYLERFRSAATGLPGLNTDQFNDDEWWALGRHSGLVTRLLDWTYSPYVAAFFAFSDWTERKVPGFTQGVLNYDSVGNGDRVVVWALAPFNDVFIEGEFNLVSPRKDLFHRQKAQNGLFTRLNHDTYLDVETYLASRGLDHYLERIELDAMEFGKALNDLWLMNISHATLFPDVLGAALSANIAMNLASVRRTGVQVRLQT